MNVKEYLRVPISFAALSAVAFSAAAAPTLPTLVILEPQNGQEYAAGEMVTVQLTTQDFTFAPAGQQRRLAARGPQAGHAHLWVDALDWNHATTQELNDLTPVSLGPLAVGEHTVGIELTQVDHQPFVPPVRASVTFRIEGRDLVGGNRRGVSGMSDFEMLAIAVLAIGVLWFAVQKGAVKWLTAWASWEKLGMKKKDSSPPQSPPSPQA